LKDISISSQLNRSRTAVSQKWTLCIASCFASQHS
jgi:hypothetical protein